MDRVNKIRLYVAGASAVIGLISFELTYRILLAVHRTAELPSELPPVLVEELGLNENFGKILYLVEHEGLDIERACAAYGLKPDQLRTAQLEFLHGLKYNKADFESKLEAAVTELMAKGHDRLTAAAEVFGMRVEDLHFLVKAVEFGRRDEAAMLHIGFTVEELRSMGFEAYDPRTAENTPTSEETEQAEAEAAWEREIDEYFDSLSTLEPYEPYELSVTDRIDASGAQL